MALKVVEVIIQCATEGATIHYTTDGSEPREDSPTTTSDGTVPVELPGTLKAKAWKDGMTPSAVNSALYDGTTDSGIPFSWLEEHDLPTDGSKDHECIGESSFTVLEEWVAGTNPHDITDNLRMTELPKKAPDGFGRVSLTAPTPSYGAKISPAIRSSRRSQGKFRALTAFPSILMKQPRVLVRSFIR